MMTLHPDTRIGHVHLHVSDIERSRKFYTELIGLDVTASMLDGSAAFMSAGGYHHHVAINIWHGKNAPHPAANATGLYHFALLFPSRKELARVLKRLLDAHYPIGGSADHLVSESIYISDPDGNGIELTVDRPKKEWKKDKDGNIVMGVEPLDLDALLLELKKKQ